jgi:hypothetical protein
MKCKFEESAGDVEAQAGDADTFANCWTRRLPETVLKQRPKPDVDCIGGLQARQCWEFRCIFGIPGCLEGVIVGR